MTAPRLDREYNPGLDTLRQLRATAITEGRLDDVARLDGKIAAIELRQTRRVLTASEVRRQLSQLNIGATPAYGVIRGSTNTDTE